MPNLLNQIRPINQSPFDGTEENLPESRNRWRVVLHASARPLRQDNAWLLREVNNKDVVLAQNENYFKNRRFPVGIAGFSVFQAWLGVFTE